MSHRPPHTVACGTKPDDRTGAGSSVAGCFARPRFFEEKGIEIFPGVSLDPGIRFGKPCLAGTRIDIATVVDKRSARG